MAENNSCQLKKLKTDLEDEDEDFIHNDKVTSIVNLLNKYKIKLWEVQKLDEVESGVKIDSLNSTLDDLIQKLSDESGLMESEAKEILFRLQRHSIKKFEANKRYTKDGIAIFSLKIIGNNNKTHPKTFKQNIELAINMTGREMKYLIKDQFQLDCDNLKLIYNGKLIKDEHSLSAQELKNHSIIMVMCIYERLAMEAVNSNLEDYKLISDIRDAVGILTDSKAQDDLQNDLQLRNQNGIAIDISKDDQRCLTLAMVLHQRAKKLIKDKEYLKALILLAEADNEFKNCNDRALLERIDNYALLNLDIVWCYLCLQNLHDLKNAEDRIYTCEKCLEKCYGANMERLTLLQGNANKYTPIFIRLNLLKAILNYHKGKKKECKQFLDIASEELQRNTVDEEKLLQVMQMGFTTIQSRLALRQTGGDVNAAIEQIIKKRELKKKAEKIEEEKRYSKKLEEKYGRTIKDSKLIDVNVLKDLIQFGYTEEKAARALIQSNNDFNLALDILQSSIYDDEIAEEPKASTSNATDDKLVQLSGMGYDVDISKLCLQAFGSNIQKSIDFLLSNQGDRTQIEKELLQKVADVAAAVDDKKSMELIRKQQAKDLIYQDAPEDDEEYLDFNLEEDSLFLNKYFSLLNL